MATRTEEEDFRTFRHNADPAAMGRVFDSVAPKLLLVAGHLSGDGGEAEDLVQTTILHAIRDAGRWDPERPLMPWLLGILSRRALDQRRRQATRATQPLEEQPGDIDTLELAANRELRESIARSVDALGEPYRQVLVLSVAHGLEPVEIAHALGRPPGTVRMQLKRGREQLRDALPRGVALPAMLLADTGGGLGAVRQRVLDGLTPLAAPTDDVPNHSPGSEAIQVTRTASPLGGWKAVYTAVGVSASIGAGVLLWSAITNDGGPSNRSLSDPGIVARISDPTAAVDLITPDSTPLAATRKTAQETRVPATEPTLRVTYERDGTPAVGVGLYLRELDGQQLASELRTDGGGFASVASLRHGRYRIDIDRGALPIDVELLPGSTIELKIRVGINVQGEVVDRTGTPVARARVLRLNPDHHDRLQWVATTGVRGEFSLPDVAPGTTFCGTGGGLYAVLPGCQALEGSHSRGPDRRRVHRPDRPRRPGQSTRWSGTRCERPASEAGTGGSGLRRGCQGGGALVPEGAHWAWTPGGHRGLFSARGSARLISHRECAEWCRDVLRALAARRRQRGERLDAGPRGGV